MQIVTRRVKCAAFLVVLALLSGKVSGSDEDGSASNECSMSPREVVGEFIKLFYEQKKVREAFETWVHPDYIQHKSTLPDGREPVISFLEGLLQRFPDRIFTVHRVIASEDLVAVHYHSQANPDDLGFAVVDIFRVEDCKMVEHWDGRTGGSGRVQE